ncbi:hypothetical protein PanWU01x14_319240 [Parasponia andersonii]|uniref:Uncharacterized protein n=1 Tax=Parasponia andersonii TaxID=3476 RepID=A0A2P5ALZ7_PARAD|nr:hypothetical protein PanWU01x14_319240 [Parasponia andersonii]
MRIDDGGKASIDALEGGGVEVGIGAGVETEALCEKAIVGGRDKASRDLVGELAGVVYGAWAKMQGHKEENSGLTHNVYDNIPVRNTKISPIKALKASTEPNIGVNASGLLKRVTQFCRPEPLNVSIGP